jgi:thioredoxin 2
MDQQPKLIRCPVCGRQNRIPASARGAPHCGACGATLPWLVDSGEPDFRAVVEESSLPVLVDFWAPWCGPCRVVSPLVERMGEELRGQLKVVKVNSDEAPSLANRFGIRGIPTLILFDHGRERARVTGAMGGPALRDWVQSHLASIRTTSGVRSDRASGH